MKNRSISLIVLLVILIISTSLHAQQFAEQTEILLEGVSLSSVAWADYDNDGNLDILLTGKIDDVYTNNTPVSKIYRNVGDGKFTEQVDISLVNVYGGSVAWGDYDNDGYLDIILTGIASEDNRISKIYRNNGNNSFTEQTNINFIGVAVGSVAWGDYDNDGDLDVILIGDTGKENEGLVSKIYKNNADNTFTEQTEISLPGTMLGSAAWGDYDNDGDLDILLNGEIENGTRITKIYKNIGENFVEATSIHLQGLVRGAAIWGDYDNDGDLDILHSGNVGVSFSRVYKNLGNDSFVEQTSIALTGTYESSVSWGDYDNDGDLDILLTGNNETSQSPVLVSKIYKNNGDDTFSEQNDISLTGVYMGKAIWGDYDNDGDLDILLTGSSGSLNALNPITKIYKNILNNNFVEQEKNDIPNKITNLHTEVTGSMVTFSWDKATDPNQNDGLNYNLYVYETSKHLYSRPSHSFRETDALNGKRLITQIGMIQQNLYKLNLSIGNYVWSVQAVDACYEGGEFAAEQPFTIEEPQSIEFLQKLNIKIYPNPVSNILNIDLNGNQVEDIKLINFHGETVLGRSKVIGNIKFDLSKLQMGVYLLLIEKNNNIFGMKIIKK